MKRNTPLRGVLFLLASLLCALPGAALAQEQPHKMQDAAPPPAGELIFHVAVHKDFATDRCGLTPRLFRHPDGSLSSVSEAIGHLSEVEINRLYVEGKVFHYQNWRGERHTCRDVRITKSRADWDDDDSKALTWSGVAHCTGSSIFNPRGDNNLLLPTAMDIPENPASLSGPDMEELLARSQDVAEAYMGKLFEQYGRIPASPIRDGLSLRSPPACGDLDGDGLRDCVVLWHGNIKAGDGDYARPDCWGAPSVAVAVLADGNSAVYFQREVKTPECSAIYIAGILPMADGGRLVVIPSSYTGYPTDLVDFSSHPPRRVARFID